MTTVAEIADWMEQFAPTRLAEPWDNVGLLFGDPEHLVSRVMTCLTVTEATVAEALDQEVGLIVSHHPIWFKPTQQLRADRPDGFLWSLAKAGVAIYSPHTAFDNTNGGINDFLAERLGLADVGPLKPHPPGQAYKIVVFTPESDREAVLSAVFNAGAGRIGDYIECSYAVQGVGTFFGTEGTNPTVGQAGRRETVHDEQRLEFNCPSDRLAPVLEALRAAHSYEEPAMDIYPTHIPSDGPGIGRIGRLSEPLKLADLSRAVSEKLPAPSVQAAGDPNREIERLAIACGGADDFVKDAAKAGADAFLTGEARFHRGWEAQSLGIGLLLAGHDATERPAVGMLADRLAQSFPQLTIWPSRREHDPFWPA